MQSTGSLIQQHCYTTFYSSLTLSRSQISYNERRTTNHLITKGKFIRLITSGSGLPRTRLENPFWARKPKSERKWIRECFLKKISTTANLITCFSIYSAPKGQLKEIVRETFSVQVYLRFVLQVMMMNYGG